MEYAYVVVGAGLYGAVIAERIADELNEPVLVIDKRKHIGGNSYSEINAETGIECHTYGSHIFHTSNEAVWNYINRFSAFNKYKHKVLSVYQDKIYHIPINLLTINSFFNANMSPGQAEDFIKSQVSKGNGEAKNFEEKAISLMGVPLYEAFIKGYTAKQWQTEPAQLPASIINRIPAKFNYDMGYFSDTWEGIPTDGYTAVFKKILDHPNINVHLGVDFFDVRETFNKNCFVVYSGPLDRYFDYKYGALNYRSLRFENAVMPVKDFQGTSVMNYAEVEIPYTRIHEFRHYHPERRSYPSDKTCISYEYSLAYTQGAEPYYPVNTPEDKARAQNYREEARGNSNVLCGGRLGSYQYLDMDDAIALALEDFASVIAPGHMNRVANKG